MLLDTWRERSERWLAAGVPFDLAQGRLSIVEAWSPATQIKKC
jgi:hypothetical protein